MGIREQLLEDMKAAMKDRDEVALSTIRFARSAVRYAEIEQGKELDDDGITEVIQREAKRRQEAIELYEKGGRHELAEKERTELEVLKRYLPEQLSEAEATEIISGLIAEVGAAGPKDKGKVMGLLMQRHRGKLDGKLANELVDRILQS